MFQFHDLYFLDAPDECFCTLIHVIVHLHINAICIFIIIKFLDRIDFYLAMESIVSLKNVFICSIIPNGITQSKRLLSLILKVILLENLYIFSSHIVQNRILKFIQQHIFNQNFVYLSGNHHTLLF